MEAIGADSCEVQVIADDDKMLPDSPSCKRKDAVIVLDVVVQTAVFNVLLNTRGR